MFAGKGGTHMNEYRRVSESWGARVKGAVLGHALGDALGMPVEFVPKQILRSDPVTSMRGFGMFHQPPGTWSDNTSLMLCLLETLVEKWDPDRLAERLVSWLNEGVWTPHGVVFDVGATTMRALSRMREGARPLQAGEPHEKSNQNGSLKRVLPVAFLDRLSDEEAADLADQASCLTHRHPRARMACGLMVLLCRRLLRGDSPAQAYRAAVAAADPIYDRAPYAEERSHFARFLDGKLGEIEERGIRSTNYVVHTLEASVWCMLQTESFRDAVLKAVNLGNDTDSTGSLTGGLAGATYGYSALPTSWLEVLARREDLEELVERFIRARNGGGDEAAS